MTNMHFMTGYRCNLVLYIIECSIALALSIVYTHLPLPAVIVFAVFFVVSVSLLYRGNKKKPFSEKTHGYVQCICSVVAHISLSFAFDSAQSFIFAMCCSSVLTFVYVNMSIAKFHMYLSDIIIVIATCFVSWYNSEIKTLLVFVFGMVVLIIMNWIVASMSSTLAFQYRTNAEQERSLDDLLKVVEAKCDEARNATRSKTRFLANMSHEIRTPINSIMGMNEMILRESGEKDICGYAFEAKNAAESLLSIINDILDITKIEEGRLSMVSVNYRLKRIITDVHNMIKFRAEAKQLQFDVSVDSDLPSVLKGDDIRLKQILTNLLTNAVKYTHKGRIKLEVRNLGDGCIRYSVSDTGIGIKPQDISRLFGAFDRIEETRNRSIEGTGLGLNITSNLLDMMGSKLQVTSEYGKGSVFFFDLKQEIVDATPVGVLDMNAAREMKQEKYAVSFVAPDAEIMVVDDNMMNRMVLINLLKQTGVRITEAASGMECLELAARKKYDLIFMDHMMPEMDGVEAFHLLRSRADSLCRETPVVVLTANAVIGAEKNYLKEGFDAFLSKPVEPKKLEKTVFNMLDESLIHEGAPVAEDDSAQHIELPATEGIDWQYARLHLSEDSALMETVKLFYMSLKNDIAELDGYFSAIDDAPSCDSYRIKVHSMKSSAALIGIVSLAGMAMELERAARAYDSGIIKALHPVFRERWLSYYSPLGELFDSGEPKKSAADNASEIDDIFAAIRAAAEEMDVDKLDELSAKLDGYSFDGEKAQRIEEVKNLILNFDIETLMNIQF